MLITKFVVPVFQLLIGTFQLDYKVNIRKLKDIFRIAGTIVNCDLKVDKDGKSRGMGMVKYDHPMEAVQAIGMSILAAISSFYSRHIS